MKKLYKLLFIFVLMFGIFSISTSIVYAEEPIPEEDTIPDIEEGIPLEPSELSKWIDENIIEVVVATLTAIIAIVAAYLRFRSIINKALELITKQKKEASDIQTSSTDEIKKLNIQVLSLITELIEVKKELKETKEASVLANNTFEQLKEEQSTTKEMLRIGLSNDKELVRLGIAEEINKIAKKGV